MKNFSYRDNANVKYDQTNYESNGIAQSFVVDLTTDKVYSLAEIGHIYFIENNIVQANDTFYALSIIGENVVFTDLMPNKNIYAGRAYIDKDGMIFVDNNAVNEITDNVVYIRGGHDATGDGYYSSGIGSDGSFYSSPKTVLLITIMRKSMFLITVASSGWRRHLTIRL